MPAHAAIVFDAYGTPLDVHAAVARHAALPGSAAGRIATLAALPERLAA